MKIYLKSFILKYFLKNKRNIYIFAVISLMVLFFISLSVGASRITAKDVLELIIGKESSKQAYNVIYYVRLPRSLAALLCGAALALSGLLLQSSLNNAMASAGTIGVNSGAGFFVVLSSVAFPGIFLMRPVTAFTGAFLTAMLVYAIAKKIDASGNVIILTGIAVTSLMSAGIDVLVTIWPESLMDRSAFYIGGFANITLNQVTYTLPFLIIGFIISLVMSTRMNALSLGDEVAASIGLSVKQCRFIIMAAASLLAASAVCIGGLIGFVGLIVPHIARALIGSSHQCLVPVVVLLGGILTLACDILARTLFSPYELPVGILLSFLGAPFFLYLLLRGKRQVIS